MTMPSSERPPRGLFDRMPLEEALRQTQTSGYKRALGPWSLTNLGIAAIIGAGIFVLLGQEARDPTGPAVVVSLVIAGTAAVLAALAYAEFASAIPGSGSAYLYAYATLGRLPAFMMGWLILNAYAVGNMTVAIGWGGFLTSGLDGVGLRIPAALRHPPGVDGGLFNAGPALVMVLVTLLCLPRIRESTLVNNVLVALKIGIVLFVIGLGAFFVRPSNYTPFAPGGMPGILQASAVLFFAYLGFDVVSATAEEARNPRRDLPIGIIGSVVGCMVLFVLMGLVVTGMVRASDLDAAAPVASAFSLRGMPWAAGIITVGALLGLATVLYGFHVALARILHSMARDGFLPALFARLHPSTGTPWGVTILAGLLTALGAGLLDFRNVGDMTVEASLAVYALVAGGVLVLKVAHPEAERRFRVHAVVPVAAIIMMVGIAVTGLGSLIHLVFLAWIGLGLVLYGFYGHRRAWIVNPE